MIPIAPLAFALLLSSSPASDPTDCPLHASHMAAAAHREEVDARGDGAMGFSQEATTHHFRATESGGIIEVTVRDAADSATLAAVRSHLQHIAVAFEAGDFSIPEAVHAQVPPGVAAMRRAGDAISYRYQELPAGAQVVITATGKAAVDAVHDFLGFQVAEHGTGD
ncbi:MAG TPA: hypothetical protein VGV61_07045 [Thermoanaerobaculia bacterium]|jgi:hypothetical protein|nr:hypothetical protein [Thermoanaerobaculia bacterium]